MSPFYYVDQAEATEAGVRPKHYDQIMQLYAKYYEDQAKGKKPEELPEPLQLVIHYTEDLKEACIESNIELEKMIELPSGVVKVESKPDRFVR
jgi:hypothetical protein